MIEPTYLDPIVNGEPPQKEFGEDPFKRGLDKTETRYKVFEQRVNGNKMQVNTQEGKFVEYEDNYVVEGSLRTTEGKATTTKEKKISIENKKQRIQVSRNSSITQTRRGTELNPRGITRAAGGNGAGLAADSFNLWFPILVDNYVTHKSLNDRLSAEKLSKAKFFRDNYPVPPEPKDLSKIRLRFEREYGKEITAVIMMKLEEISYATYGK